jgi:nucleotide-binding universal stress UspA family protein
MAKQRQTNLDSGPKHAASVATPFRRMLVAIDESPAAEAAVGLVAQWVDWPGADVRFVQVSEERRQRRSAVESGASPLAVEQQAHRLVVGASTLGARNRQLVHGIAEQAEDFGADVIVVGFDRRRLAGHRLAPSLREQVMRVTDVPVLVVPSPQPDGRRHHPPVPDMRHDRVQADAAPRYARV